MCVWQLSGWILLQISIIRALREKVRLSDYVVAQPLARQHPLWPFLVSGFDNRVVLVYISESV